VGFVVDRVARSTLVFHGQYCSCNSPYSFIHFHRRCITLVIDNVVKQNSFTVVNVKSAINLKCWREKEQSLCCELVMKIGSLCGQDVVSSLVASVV
jgi:hypothetical protein